MADRIRVLRRMLWLVFFSVLTVVVGNGVLLAVPQARETLFAIEDGTSLATWLHFALFCLAYLYWAFTAWFVARLMVGRCFVRDIVQPPAGFEVFAGQCARWLPRVLGLLAAVPLAVTMFALNVVFGLVMAALAAGFLGFVILRHRIAWLADPARSAGQSDYRCFEHMTPRAKGWLALLFAVSWLVFVAVWMWPVDVGRALGAPVLLLVALGAWTLFGSIVLSYWPNTHGWWTFNWVPIVLALLGSLWDNHPVAAAPPGVAPPAAGQPDWRSRRMTLEAHYVDWMGRHVPGEPVYMVAVAGGASRAAYWAGMVLGQLQDEAAAQERRFGENIFMLSSISGGSLGASAFVTALAAAPSQGVMALLDPMLGNDFLGPVVGMMLFPDFVQRFVPWLDRVHPADRSRALENAWSADWLAAAQRAGVGQPRPWWQAPIVQPYVDAPTRPLPSLLLNTVRLEDGQRMLQSNLAFDLPDAFDLLSARFDTHFLTLAGAVHNSARFPYVSPAGRVHLRESGGADAPDRRVAWGRLGDGGYHEASGGASLADVIERLQHVGLIVRDTQGRLQACPVAGRPQACTSPVVIVMLDNLPSAYGPAWRRQPDGTPRQPDPLQLEASWPLNEATAPPQGLIRAWTSNGTRAEWRLSRLAGDAPERYVELRLPLCPAKDQPSMTWHLNGSSRKLMRRVAREGCGGDAPANLADQALRANLQRLRQWIAARGES